MRIFGLAVVKNEEDIIEYSLTRASAWAYRIFVMDNGSNDGTWDKVCSVARSNPVIVPWKQCDDFFSDGIRARIFNEFKHYARAGDWWCARLDADEFYIDEPKAFLESKVKPYYHVVCSKHIQYRLTDTDIDDMSHKDMGIEERISRLSYFDRYATSEIRFFRHRKGLKWDETNSLPRHIGLVCPERMLVRHYQYRSLEQIQKRIQTRLLTRQQHPHIFPHVSSERPEEYIAKTTDCVKDTRQLSLYNQLPLSNNINLEYRWWSFWLRRLLHGTGIFP